MDSPRERAQRSIERLIDEAMKALVTGGAGFIGGHIARDLCRKGADVTIIDNLRTGSMKNVPETANFFRLDLGRDPLEEAFGDGFDIVYHFAGQSSVEISYSDPLYDLDTNCRSTLQLLDLCKRNGTDRFIFASTMSVYGGRGAMPKDETAPRDGENFYAISKKASEDYLWIYDRFGVKSTALRLFNIYGPGQNLENLRQGMLSIYLAQAINTGRVVVKGSLERTRDFVYIDDVVGATMAVARNESCWGKAINICSGKEVSVRETIELISKSLKQELSIEIAAGTPGDIDRMVGRPDLLKELTGYECQVSLEQGLDSMVNSLKGGDYYA